MSYYFFLSYAHDDDMPKIYDDPKSDVKIGPIKKFYLDLCVKLRGRTALPENEIGFFDDKEIPLGTKWSQELSEAIQSSKIFVSIYSPTYFRKPYCGKEWTVFNLRKQAYAKAHGVEEPALMIPVLWQKKLYVERDMPDLLKKDQYTHGDFGEHYTRLGLADILSDKELREKYYEGFLANFSDKLINAVDPDLELPRLETDKPLEEIEPVFPPATTDAAGPIEQPADANPRYVKFVFVVGREKEMREAKIRQRLEYYREKGGEWTPYLPDDSQQIDLLVQLVAIKRKFSAHGTIDLNDKLLDSLEEAKKNNQIVVIVVDSWSLKIQNYREWMSKFDERSFLNCIVVIPWINDDETAANRAELEKFVKASFPSWSRNRTSNFLNFIGPFKDPVTKLKEQLGKTLSKTKQKILDDAEVQRAISGGQATDKPGISATSSTDSGD
jgi:FxsC-like protein